ncbi:MAG: response regulator transcription factor, partial [Marinilabiliaceae bacterium]|nr:response regulator transcription factor [Marinilabiliaceae bacterium]
MKSKVLIVEDEMPSARKLRAFLEKIEPDFDVVAILESVQQTVKFLSENAVDLIFLDIHLADGNSFGIFNQVEVNAPIIFTTAYDQYAIEAFTQNSIGYLLKPLSKEKLEMAIAKFKQMQPSQHKAQPAIDYQQLGKIIAQQQKPDYQERFMVYYKDKIKTVPVEDIAYFYADGKAVFMSLHNHKTFDLNFTLEQLEAKLNPRYFFRANRKYIVNIKAVKEAMVYSKSKLKLHLAPDTPTDVIVSSLKA